MKLLMITGLILSAASAQAVVFSPPARITDGSSKAQLARNPRGAAAFDTSGTLHLAYWTGTAPAASTAAPDAVLHRQWTLAGGWTAAQTVDDGSEQAGQRVGGRHPNLAIAGDGSLWITWQDNRHSTAAGNWIDNTEIYADRKYPGGSFLPSDIRLTNSGSGSGGDNGYTPRVARGAGPKLEFAWYDFAAGTGSTSDFYAKTVTVGSPQFIFNESMSQMQVTDAAARGGSPSYSFVDLAVDSTGTRHLVWLTGFGAGTDIVTATVGTSGTLSVPASLATAAGDAFDPPRIAAAPSGDAWVAYGDDSAVGGAEKVTLRRKPAGTAAFGPAIVVDSRPARQYAPDLAFDADGGLRVVWIDERSAAGAQVFAARVDPATSVVTEAVAITPTPGPWTRPALARRADGGLAVVFEEARSASQGDIWWSTTIPAATPNAARDWGLYD